MKQLLLLFAVGCLFLSSVSTAQEPDYSRIDKMIIFGDYVKAVDTCKLILASDSSNSAIWYKLGLAQQNILPDTGSFNCYLKAYEYDKDNSFYKFTVARSYFNKNKNLKAKPLFRELCASDSANWNYAYYLTNIYIQEGRYDQAINIYNRFYESDSSNYVILDKLGFAYLKKNQYETAIDYYNRSLALNSRNIDAIRNLSFLYPNVLNIDTAIVLLTRAIKMEPDDVDLYARRATIYFAKNYNKRALNDYLKILSLGDSSALYLKRAGIGYMYNLQPDLAIPYFLKANVRDTMDFETLDFLGYCYNKLNDNKKSIYYYNKLVTLLKGFQMPLGSAYMSLASQQKTVKQYLNAIGSYSSAYKVMERNFLLIYIANIYDESLQDIPKAISSYKQFLTVQKKPDRMYSAEYIESIKKRVEYLENKLAEEKAKKEYNAQPSQSQ